MDATGTAEPASFATLAYQFDPRRRRLARSYGRRNLAIGLLGTAAFALVLLLLWTHQVMAAIRADLTPVAGTGWSRTALVVLAFVALLELATLPWALVGHLLERTFGFARGGWRRWARDTGKSVGGVLALSTPLLLLFLWVAGRGPWWWLLAWGGSIALALLGALAGPVILLPFFFKTAPPPADVAGRIDAIQRRAGIRPLLPVLVVQTSAKTRKVNAAVAGIGPTRRMLLYDTLLERTPAGEVDGVVAHELAHAALRHLERGIAVRALVGFASFASIGWVTSANGIPASDPASLPVLGLLFLGTSSVLGPLLNAFSRHQEAQADLYGLALLGDHHGMASLQRRLADMDLIDDSPPRVLEVLFASHPAPARRIDLLERAAAGQVPMPTLPSPRVTA